MGVVLGHPAGAHSGSFAFRTRTRKRPSGGGGGSVPGLLRDTAERGEGEPAKVTLRFTAMIRPTTTARRFASAALPNHTANPNPAPARQISRCCRACGILGFDACSATKHYYRFIVVRAWFRRKTHRNVYICSTSVKDRQDRTCEVFRWISMIACGRGAPGHQHKIGQDRATEQYRVRVRRL